MSKKMLIDATHAEETRVVVVNGTRVDEFDFEALNKRQLAGNIYLAKVTRVEPSLQAAFVDYGGNRHGFLAFSEIHPDYYQIPAADREELLREEAEYAKSVAEEEERDKEREQAKPKSRSRRRRRKAEPAAEGAANAEDAVIVEEVPAEDTDAPAGDAPVVEATVEEPQEEDALSLLVETPETSAAGPDDAEVVAESDEAEIAEVRAPRVRKPRMRRYKIQEVMKVRQILLIQVVKEERGNKGAAVSTYLSLAGRYCVLMPNTARGGGISRKIANVADRKKLKEISNSMPVPEGAGLIIRTAGAQRTKAEIKRDYEYLRRQWENIRNLTMKSIAPAPIYEEGSLIKRSIRDLYNKDIDEVIVDGERGYREAKDYMKMLMPSHAKNVKRYSDPLPVFSRYNVESYLSAMFNPTVQLKSGGYIVIGITEALVAIDVNSGRATKEKSIEDTATKTNLEAASEVARQLRLRDLAGLIVIDFIDMEDRRNNVAVEKRMKDALKGDRARIQVGRISSFGLMEMSRQRLRPGMLEASTQPCPHCHGTGITRSNDSMSLAILRELEEEGAKNRSKEVLVSAPVNVANYLLNAKREHIGIIESRFGLSVRVESDPTLISPEYRVERFKTATRIVPIPETLPMLDMADMPDFEDEPETESTAEAPVDPPVEARAETDEEPPKKRRRRRRRGGKNRNNEGEATNTGESSGEAKTEAVPEVANPADDSAEKPKRSRSRSRRRTAKPEAEAETEVAESASAPEVAPEATPEVAEKPKRKRRSRTKAPATEAPVETPTETPVEAKVEPVVETAAELAPEQPKKRARVTAKAPSSEPEVAKAEATASEPVEKPEVEAPPAAKAPTEDKPKRRGWWSRKPKE
ncbi:MAG: Rne/Rng family ribonuclease [Rhodobacteraceae bacterium]|nr:Rne/Rng family ribonuclease [Paracoccaceae bacterium]